MKTLVVLVVFVLGASADATQRFACQWSLFRKIFRSYQEQLAPPKETPSDSYQIGSVGWISKNAGHITNQKGAPIRVTKIYNNDHLEVEVTATEPTGCYNTDFTECSSQKGEKVFIKRQLVDIILKTYPEHSRPLGKVTRNGRYSCFSEEPFEVLAELSNGNYRVRFLNPPGHVSRHDEMTLSSIDAAIEIQPPSNP